MGHKLDLKAIAARQGITADDELKDLTSGHSEELIKAPNCVREVIKEMGLGHVLALFNILELADATEVLATDS